MAQQNIGVGTVANDGTGDPIRTAFVKTQNNFSEFYAAFAPVLASNNVVLANNMTSGNSTVNSTANSTGIFFNAGFVTANGTVVAVGNTTANITVNSTAIFHGNSTINAISNSTVRYHANSTANSTFSTGHIDIKSTSANLVVGNSTVNFLQVNSSIVNILTSNIAGHTAAFANGYVQLPAGLKLIFGTLATANSTAQAVTFNTVAGASFSVNVFTVFATANNSATNIAVTTANSTTLTLQTNNATAQTAFWAALGL